MAIIPPQYQSGPQSEHGIHRLIPHQTVQLVTLINGQNTTLSRREEIISCGADQQDVTRLRHTSSFLMLKEDWMFLPQLGCRRAHQYACRQVDAAPNTSRT
jgi:hypothetical protein